MPNRLSTEQLKQAGAKLSKNIAPVTYNLFQWRENTSRKIWTSPTDRCS
jgi:hypothetical protein